MAYYARFYDAVQDLRSAGLLSRRTSRLAREAHGAGELVLARGRSPTCRTARADFPKAKGPGRG